MILARPAKGLAAVLVYDLPHTVSSVPAEEAAAMGMVNAVVPHAELEGFALDWAGEILTRIID